MTIVPTCTCPHCSAVIDSLILVQEYTTIWAADEYVLVDDDPTLPPKLEAVGPEDHKIYIKGLKYFEPQCCGGAISVEYYKENIEYCNERIRMGFLSRSV